jgi:hypothetical protein
MTAAVAAVASRRMRAARHEREFVRMNTSASK